MEDAAAAFVVIGSFVLVLMLLSASGSDGPMCRSCGSRADGCAVSGLDFCRRCAEKWDIAISRRDEWPLDGGSDRRR